MNPRSPYASLPAFSLAAALAASAAVCCGHAPPAHAVQADDSRWPTDSDLRTDLSRRPHPHPNLRPGEICAELLENSDPRIEVPPVDSILSYLSQLHEGLLPEDQFGTKELKRMESALESEGRLINP